MMKYCNERAIILVLAALPLLARAQSDIPIGSWRVHPSYNFINHVALQTNQKVFGAADHGIMVIDRTDNSISTYTRLDGLQGSAITSIAYDNSAKSLLIAYENGKFDIIDAGNTLSSFNPPANTSLTGSKKINDIFLGGGMAFLATDYGVVVFDLTKSQIKETWRDLGETGDALRIVQCTINEDSIFLGTEHGVLAGSLSDNLQDFNSWKRFNTGVFAGSVQSIATFQGAVYAAINTVGILTRQNGSWTLQSYLQGDSFTSLTPNAGSLMVALPSGLWKLNELNEISSIASDIIDDPRQAIVDEAGDVWVGDGKNGLVSDVKGSFEAFLPNCPVNNETFRLSYQQALMYSLPGGYSDEGLALHRPGIIDIFQDGSWTSTLTVNQDITDIQIMTSTETVLSSFGNGLEIRGNENDVTILNETNSPLINANPPGRSVNVTSLAISPSGVWVANYASTKPLHLLKEDKTWESFSFPVSSTQYPLDLVVDLSGNVWLLLDPLQGGGILVFNRENNAFRYLTDVAGQGGLPSKSAHSIAVDRDGFVWVGTTLGAAYFNNSTGVFNGTVDAIRPIVDGRFLLRDDKVTAIAVDGGNRKWFGTDRGVWLYGPEGDQVIENFTTGNSPLPSDTVRDIEINGESGEVFFATAEGLSSFRSGATQSGMSQSVKVFPNPVTSSFVGTVGISGTPQDAIVKITDITGKLVFETKASGGTALWQVQDNKGRRVSTGVYIVFVVTPDGEERLASKIAVVD